MEGSTAKQETTDELTNDSMKIDPQLASRLASLMAIYEQEHDFSLNGSTDSYRDWLEDLKIYINEKDPSLLAELVKTTPGMTYLLTRIIMGACVSFVVASMVKTTKEAHKEIGLKSSHTNVTAPIGSFSFSSSSSSSFSSSSFSTISPSSASSLASSLSISRFSHDPVISPSDQKVWIVKSNRAVLGYFGPFKSAAEAEEQYTALKRDPDACLVYIAEFRLNNL